MERSFKGIMNKSYYAIIPANVRYDNDLTPNAKLLYGEITALCNEKGYCWASNEYFAELYKTSTRTVSRWIQQLISKGYITSKLIYRKGTKEVEQRQIYIGVIGGDKNVMTYGQKCHEGMDKNVMTPIDKNVLDNNTVFNNTINNNSSSSSETDKEDIVAYYRREIVNRHILTKLEQDFFLEIGNQVSNDLVIRAMEISIESNVRELRYIKGIIKKWIDADIRTLEQLKSYELKMKSQKEVKSNDRKAKRTVQVEISKDDGKSEAARREELLRQIRALDN